jgi:DNA/RNA-binding protein KIN17
MNSTRWQGLTEFAKYLGRENICRVTEEDDNGQPGIYIAWINNDPAAMRRNEASKKKDKQDKGDEEREAKAIQEQIERAHAAQKEKTETPLEEGESPTEEDDKHILDREQGSKIALNFGVKPKEDAPKSEVKVATKPKNVFAMQKKEAKAKKPSVFEAPKKMTEAERIMKSEIERKRRFEESGASAAKRQRS